MTRRCCPTCRLRFSPVTAAQISSCPFCAKPLIALPAHEALGFKLMCVGVLADEDAG